MPVAVNYSQDMPFVEAARVDDIEMGVAFPAAHFAHQKLPTDAIGQFLLTLTNVVVGSAIRIESASGGTTIYTGTAVSSTVPLTLSAYGFGSPLNSLRIKVRKGSASPYYQPWETLTTAFVGSASIYVAQIPDE